MSKPPGSVSRDRLAAALVAFVVLVGVGLVWSGLLFGSGPPGAQAGEEPLGDAHAQAVTGGRCSACHVALWSSETMSDRCVLCHADVAAQLRDPTSLHGVVMRSGEIESCYHCHPEHRGSGAGVTALDPLTFPHEAAGYSLQGHRQKPGGSSFACTDCHGEHLTHFHAARCSECHWELDAAYMQEHEASCGLDCMECHDGSGTEGAPFDCATAARG
jgi:hypothetical protein